MDRLWDERAAGNEAADGGGEQVAPGQLTKGDARAETQVGANQPRVLLQVTKTKAEEKAEAKAARKPARKEKAAPIQAKPQTLNNVLWKQL